MAQRGIADADRGSTVKIVSFIVRLIVGGVFVVSAILKIWNVQMSRAHGLKFSYVPDLATFAKDVANYHVPPYALSNLVAMTLPWIELLAGGLLIAGIWKRASALTITAMMVIFLAAIGWAVAHGYDIRCGCFGTIEARKVGITSLGQDFLLFLAAAWLAWREKD